MTTHCLHPSPFFLLILSSPLTKAVFAPQLLAVGVVQIPGCHKFPGSPLYSPELPGSLKLIIWKAPKMELLRKKISSESCNTFVMSFGCCVVWQICRLIWWLDCVLGVDRDSAVFTLFTVSNRHFTAKTK